MTAEEFYKELRYTEYDKFDKKVPKFDYYDLTDFAEQYHTKQLKLSVVSQQRELLNGYEEWLETIDFKTDRMTKKRLIDIYLTTI